MTTYNELEREDRNKKIVARYEELEKQGAVNKTALGKEFNVSLRTVKRVLDAAGINWGNKSKPNTAKAAPIKEKPPVVHSTQAKHGNTKQPSVPKKTARESAQALKKPLNAHVDILSWNVQQAKQIITLVLTDGRQIVTDGDNPNYADIILALATGDVATDDIVTMCDM